MDLYKQNNVVGTKALEQNQPFQFKQFAIAQDRCHMKIGTDGVLLGAWANINDAQRILDVGTGTGVIAIMMGQRNAEAQIVGVEIDEQAYEQAAENMAAAPWANRLQAVQSSIQDYAPSAAGTYDVIVSNPPFFTGGTFSDNQDRQSVRHTVKLPHGDLLHAVQILLKPEGRFCLILPLIEGLRFQELAATYHFFCTRIAEVIPTQRKPVERLLLQFERQPRALIKEQIIIQQDERNHWTSQYTTLTRDFYLKME